MLRQKGNRPVTGVKHVQIGDVAQRTGLSLRTIRWYEEVGLVPPSARTAGGFRLYTADDIERLELVKRMKPLEFSLEEMRDLLTTLDGLNDVTLPSHERAALEERLVMYRELTDQRVDALRAQLSNAEQFAQSLAARESARADARNRGADLRLRGPTRRAMGKGSTESAAT